MLNETKSSMTTLDQGEMIKCCPIDNTFKIIGKKFTVHIIRNMGMHGQTRFNQMLDSIEDANPKTLSARLKKWKKLVLFLGPCMMRFQLELNTSLQRKEMTCREF